MDAATINKRLDQIDQTIGLIVPQIAQGAAIIRLVGGLVRGKMTPDQQKQFDQVIGEYDAQNAQLQSAVDRLRAASSSTGSTSASRSSGQTLDPHASSQVTAGETTGPVGDAVKPIGGSGSGPSNG